MSDIYAIYATNLHATMFRMEHIESSKPIDTHCAADRAHVSRRTIQRLLKLGILPGYQMTPRGKWHVGLSAPPLTSVRGTQSTAAPNSPARTPSQAAALAR